MSRDRLRALLIALLAVAAALSAVGNETGLHWLTALSFVLFSAAVVLIMRWRRERGAKVFDRKDKTG